MRAREAYESEGRDVDYRDVQQDPDQLEEMLQFSGGGRKVPVIVDAGKVTIGYGGT